VPGNKQMRFFMNRKLHCGKWITTQWKWMFIQHEWFRREIKKLPETET
jgi:hypothetical protein